MSQTVPPPNLSPLEETLWRIRDAHLEAFSGANRCAHLLLKLKQEYPDTPELDKLAEAMQAITKQLDGYLSPNGCNTYRDVTRLGKLLKPPKP